MAVTAVVFLAFCILRPFNQIVYAPKLRHADEKHRPPPMGKSLWAWYNPVFKTNEPEYVEKIGMDATVFLRVARMCRNMFTVLAIAGCAIVIPVNVTKSQNFGQDAKTNAIFLMTPRDVLIGSAYWAFVAVAYVFDIIVCGFLWWTYRAIHQLRRTYMESPEYQSSLYSRTLMVSSSLRRLVESAHCFRADDGRLPMSLETCGPTMALSK